MPESWKGKCCVLKSWCERIADRSSFNEGEVKGMMSLFKEELVRSLKDGDPVEIEGLVCFILRRNVLRYVTPKRSGRKVYIFPKSLSGPVRS